MSNLEFTDKELAAIREEYCAGATDTQFELFISECKARNLRPGPHLVFQLRNSKVYDADTQTSRYVKKPYWITTIGALRLIALRTGQYGGSTPAEYIYLDDAGDPTVISQIPLPSKTNKALPREPWAVRVSVKRKDFDEPITSVVRFDSVAATQKRGESWVLTDMWQKRGDAQNAKCSEADALRKAFPEELGSLYLAEEIKNEVEEPTPQTPVTPASVVPLPPAVPKVDQTPATGTATPRPGEQATVEKKEVKTEPTSAKEAAIAAVPEGAVKPASELPPPTKKKGGRPAKGKSPDNGQPVDPKPPVGGITDTDLANVGTPPPPEITEADKQAGQEFAASVDPTPTKEELKGFADRVRKLAAAGALNMDLKNYILNVGKVSDPKKLTVNNWDTALKELEALDKDKLKEVTKNAPLPPEF
jgi:hypothetical protein